MNTSSLPYRALAGRERRAPWTTASASMGPGRLGLLVDLFLGLDAFFVDPCPAGPRLFLPTGDFFFVLGVVLDVLPFLALPVFAFPVGRLFVDVLLRRLGLRPGGDGGDGGDGSAGM